MNKLTSIKNRQSTELFMTLAAVTVFTMLLAIDAGTAGAAAFAADPKFDSVTSPIITLINSFIGPLIALVGAAGTIYCIFLGVKFAKAEEPQEREKAKAHLRSSIIGFVLIFVLIVALRQALPILEKWMAASVK